MRKMMLMVLLAMSLKATAQTTRGTEFWLTYMENIPLISNGSPVFSVIVSSDVNTTGNINVPFTGFSIPFTVVAGVTTEITLPTNIYYPQGDEAIFNSGLKITSADPVNVYTYHHRQYFTDASIVLPVTELADQYLITAHADFMLAGPSEFVVEATQNNTVIEIIPSALTIGFRPPAVPFTITLNEGQVYQLQSYGDLSGTSVRSLDPLKKIAVFGGALKANIHCNYADNTLYDQVYPEISGGTEFITMPFLTFNNQGFGICRFMATEDTTSVTINAATILLQTRGQYFDTLMYIPAYVSADKPILVSQFKPSQDCSVQNVGDPTMLNIPPISLKKKKANFKSLSGPGITLFVDPHHYLNIVTASNATNLLTVDGNVVTGFQPVPANPLYSYVGVSNLSAGDHTIESDSGFNAYAYGIGDYQAYSFHLGYDSFVTTGINETGNHSIHFLNANPVHDNIRFTFGKAVINVKVELYTVQGSVVVSDAYDTISSMVEVNTARLSNGIYFLAITFDGGRIVKKMVKE